MVSYRHWSVLLWWDPNDVPHRRILPSYQAERCSVPASLCWWCCYCLADQLWVLITYARRRKLSSIATEHVVVLPRASAARCWREVWTYCPATWEIRTHIAVNKPHMAATCRIRSSSVQSGTDQRSEMLYSLALWLSGNALELIIGVIYGGMMVLVLPLFVLRSNVPPLFRTKRWRICCHLLSTEAICGD